MCLYGNNFIIFLKNLEAFFNVIKKLLHFFFTKVLLK